MATSDPACVFCRIVAGEIGSACVYQDNHVYSFLDIGPLAEGHLLLIPRSHHQRISELPAELAGRLGAAIPRLGQALRRVTGAEDYNVLCNEGQAAGQVVPHVHFHLIPRRPSDSLGYRWKASSYPPGRAAELAAKYQTELSKV